MDQYGYGESGSAELWQCLDGMQRSVTYLTSSSLFSLFLLTALGYHTNLIHFTLQCNKLCVSIYK